jgi:DNA topoisomerase VI subunit B
MMQDTASHTLGGFLSSDFCRVSSALAEEICATAGVRADMRPRALHGHAAETLYQTLQNTKIMAPPTNCLSPIGEKAILSGLYRQIKGEFYTAVSRPPSVYRGNPFVIEAGLAYGNTPDGATEPKQAAVPLAEGERQSEDSELSRVIRYANRVPLLYQQSACATFKAVLDTTWRNYGISQSRGALPAGPMVIFVHMASVWVPFTSESKEAIADYDEIHKEITLALRECGRRLGMYLRRQQRAASEYRRRNIFELYIEEVVEACHRLKGGNVAKEKLKTQLQRIASTRTGGLKTDEALGKTGGGPEGLPDSIVVTPEGIEGEVSVAEAAASSHDDAPITAPQRDGSTAERTPPKPSATKEGRPASRRKGRHELMNDKVKTGKQAPRRDRDGRSRSPGGKKR